jgi:hypothetical protein
MKNVVRKGPRRNPRPFRDAILIPPHARKAGEKLARPAAFGHTIDVGLETQYLVGTDQVLGA